jgi:SAM-dependent methyltransferase
MAKHDSHRHEATVTQYTRLLRASPSGPFAVGWGSATAQERRFALLLEAGLWRGASILDVGAGRGDLLAWLNARNFDCAYEGIDITPAMVEAARTRFPEARFSLADVFEAQLQPLSYDFVFASGLFAYAVDEEMTSIMGVISGMWQTARVACVWNALSTRRTSRAPNELHLDPALMLTRCLDLTPYVALRHDYHAGDFTVMLFREPR